MKKLIVIIALLLICTTALVAADNVASISFGFGMNFFNYEELYFITPGLLFNVPIATSMEVCIGSDFGIWPHEQDDGERVGHYFVPINVGINFLFDNQKPAFLIGVGLTPMFRVYPERSENEEPVKFNMGPYVKGGIRVQVHKMMNWYFEYQQDLPIGDPNIINTATRLYTGINFRLGPQEGPQS